MKFSVIFGFFLSLSLSPSYADFDLDNCREDYLKWTGYLKINNNNNKIKPDQNCMEIVENFLAEAKEEWLDGPFQDYKDDEDFKRIYNNLSNELFELKYVQTKMFSETNEENSKKLKRELVRLSGKISTKLHQSLLSLKPEYLNNLDQIKIKMNALPTSKLVDNDQEDYCLRKFINQEHPIKSVEIEENPRKIQTSSIDCNEKMKIIFKKNDESLVSYKALMSNDEFKCFKNAKKQFFNIRASLRFLPNLNLEKEKLIAEEFRPKIKIKFDTDAKCFEMMSSNT
jgi:hypothetical protein